MKLFKQAKKVVAVALLGVLVLSMPADRVMAKAVGDHTVEATNGGTDNPLYWDLTFKDGDGNVITDLNTINSFNSSATTTFGSWLEVEKDGVLLELTGGLLPTETIGLGQRAFGNRLDATKLAYIDLENQIKGYGVGEYTIKFWLDEYDDQYGQDQDGQGGVGADTEDHRILMCTSENLLFETTYTVEETTTSITTPTTPAPTTEWKPTTAEEIECWSLKGGEVPKYTTTGVSYAVEVKNEVQGPLCLEVFNNFKGSFTLGNTYNIYPNSTQTYAMEEVATITLDIPVALQKENRVYQMICVSQDGIPYILQDTDQNPNTITFSTSRYYAFALCYKDINA